MGFLTFAGQEVPAGCILVWERARASGWWVADWVQRLNPRSFCRSPPPAGTIGLRRYRLRPDDVVRRVKVSPGKCRCERRCVLPGLIRGIGAARCHHAGTESARLTGRQPFVNCKIVARHALSAEAGLEVLTDGPTM